MKEIARRPVLTQTISRFCVCQTEAFSSTLSLAVILCQGEKPAATSSQWYRFILANRALKKQKKPNKTQRGISSNCSLLLTEERWEGYGGQSEWRVLLLILFCWLGLVQQPSIMSQRPPYFFWLRLCACVLLLASTVLVSRQKPTRAF